MDDELRPGPERDAGDAVRVTDGSSDNPVEQAVDALLREAHLAGSGDIPEMVTRHAATVGGLDAAVYLADLQQRVLVPFLKRRPAQALQHTPLGVDSTVAGRAFQLLRIQTQDVDLGGNPEGRTRVWLPLLDGTERLGVVGVTVERKSMLEDDGGLLLVRLQRFTSLVAQLVMTKTMYGDTLVRLRRTAQMGLAAEIQWSLLPPLTFASETISIAGGMEPAYEVAGDSLDYAVDDDIARFAVFDGMGHGLSSAQLVNLVVAAYRNGRRTGLTLSESVAHIDAAVSAVYQGEAFATGLLAELDAVTGVFSWVSAGHLEPLVMRDGRLVRSLSAEPGLPLGLGDYLPMQPRSMVGSEQLQPGDLLLVYTDGVVEARSPEGDFFGLERLVDLVVRNLAAGLPAPETMRRLVRALLEHQSGDLTDDATMMLIQWHGNPRASLTT